MSRYVGSEYDCVRDGNLGPEVSKTVSSNYLTVPQVSSQLR